MVCVTAQMVCVIFSRCERFEFRAMDTCGGSELSV